MYHVENPPPTTVPTRALRTPDGEPGLAVTFFEGTDLERAVGSSVDPVVDYTWPGPPLAEPPPGLSGFENFSGRWLGTLTASETGTYEIGLEGDDGFRLWLADSLVVDDWTFGARRYKGAQLHLRTGQAVPLKIEYFQGGQQRVLRLGWHTPAALRSFEGREITNLMETYLPEGADWYDFWTNDRLAGGARVEKAVPLDILPLYVRAGSIIPLGPVVQYATERPDAPYEIRVYPGADGRFTVYEDDDETYAYEQGEYATFDLVWDDDARTLSIGARNGTFPGLVESRRLDVVMAGPGQTAGLTEATSPTRTVTYTGEALTLRFSP
jgi:alpha-D-xyloside xylohydrolase